MTLKRVVISGLAAGLVLNVLDFLANTFVLGERTRADVMAANPLLWANMNDPGRLPAYIAIDFVFGFLLAWLYAAIRPRYGPGPLTALRTAVFAWALGGAFWYLFVVMGLYSHGTFALGSVVSFVNLGAAAWVAGRLYTEENSVPPGRFSGMPPS